MTWPPPFTKNGKDINVIIETPKGNGNKYSYDAANGLYKLRKVLPEGMVFPYHFGFIPGTQGADGDPLDVLLMMDEPAYPGILVESRILGIIVASQKESGKTVRNDRIIATSKISKRYARIRRLKDIEPYRLDEIIQFFINYNAIEGRKFAPKSFGSASRALEIIRRQLHPE